MYPTPIEQLIKSFTKLPTVGRRTAERFVFRLLKSGKKEAAELALAIKNLINSVKSCEICWDFSDKNPCKICADKSRDVSIICVVAEPQDLRAIEKTENYKGLYHILRGALDSGNTDIIEDLKIQELLKRVKENNIKEVILALNPNLNGETTMMFLEKELAKARPELSITRLARGLPMGSDLQYADEITLSSAMQNRIKRHNQ